MRRTVLTAAALGGVALLALVSATGPARADIVHLKNGSKIEGKVVREGDTVLIIRGKSKMRVPADQVARIEKAPDPHELYAAKRKELDPDDADAWLALAEWCRRKKLRREQRECLERAVKVDPASETAHRGLGHVLHGGKWMTREEKLVAEGYKQVDGRWLTADEYARFEAARRKQEALRARLAEFTGPITDLVSKDDATASRARATIMKRKKDFLPYIGYYAQRAKTGALRLECLRLLDDIGYTDAAYSKVVAWEAFKDSYTKAGSYARGMIKRRKDDAALLMLVSVAAGGPNPSRRRAAGALRAIGDRRAVGALIQSLASQVSGQRGNPLSLSSILNMGPTSSSKTSSFGGAVICPAADSLEFITGLELANDVAAWVKWYQGAGGAGKN